MNANICIRILIEISIKIHYTSFLYIVYTIFSENLLHITDISKIHKTT